jgi:hypothetical protein
MRHGLTAAAPLLGTALVLTLAAGSPDSFAGPPMSVEAQALAHWVHYTRLNLNRQHADAPFIVVDGEQLRWWLVDPKGRWSGNGPALLWPTSGAAGGMQPSPLPAAPAARPVSEGGRDGG